MRGNNAGDWSSESGDSDADAGAEEEAHTKAELYRCYNGKGPAAMVLTFHKDAKLRSQCILIEFASRPLEGLYSSDLRQMHGGANGHQLFSAERAWGTNSWYMAACDCLCQITDVTLMDRLGFAKVAGDPLSPDSEQAWLQEERDILQQGFQLCVRLALELMWSNVHYFNCLPHNLALFLLPDVQRRGEGLRHVRRLTTVVLEAENMLRSVQAPDLATCLRDLAWNIETLPRMVMKHCLREGNGLRRDDATLRRVACKMFAGTASTKETLESCFSFMQRQIAYQNTNLKSSFGMRWFMSTLNPYLSQSNLGQILPEDSDWYRAWHSPQGRAVLQKQYDKLNDLNNTPLPTLGDDPQDESREARFPSPSQIAEMEWRPAGGEATQRAAAAASYLLRGHESGWTSVGVQWTGREGGLLICFSNFLNGVGSSSSLKVTLRNMRALLLFCQDASSWMGMFIATRSQTNSSCAWDSGLGPLQLSNSIPRM